MNLEQIQVIPTNTHSPLLREYLEKVVNVDFNKLAGLENELEERKLKEKDFVVCIIDELLRIAERHNWGLCKLNGYIYAYNGECWTLVDTEDFKSFLGDAAWRMGLRRTDAKIYTFQEQLFNQFVASARLNLEIEKRTSTLINLKNGTFEITEDKQQLREFNRGDGLTYQLPFTYDANAECPLFKEYINRVLPNKELQDILAEFIGYIFIKNLKLEKCLLLYGSGANGKSVFFEIINALLGKENITNLSLGNLSEEHNRALIANKLLNYGSEIRGSVDSDLFKQLVSNEPVQCRFKYGNTFMINDYAKMCFNCNELPKDVEHSEAFFRRFIIIPFDVTIPEEERNPDLADEIITTELSGIFNWVIQGLNRILFHRGFTHSDLAKEAVENYKKQSDSVCLFLEEGGYKKSNEAFKLMKFLYPQYREFCQHDGYKPLTKNNFGRRLKNLGCVIERKNNGMAVFIEQHTKN
jgi:putative DNA primase/helicase